MEIIVPVEVIERKILLIRGQKVMLDADLADIYGATTKRLNEQVRRNHNRFPEDFMFQLSEQEKSDVVANCDHIKKLKYSHLYKITDETSKMIMGFSNYLRELRSS